MTSKEYKRMCRIRVTRLGKFITYVSILITLTIAELSGLSGYATAAIVTTVWFYMPEVAAYILETVHKLNHDYVSWR